MQCKSGYAQAGKTKRDGQMPVSSKTHRSNQEPEVVVYFVTTAEM